MVEQIAIKVDQFQFSERNLFFFVKTAINFLDKPKKKGVFETGY